MIVKVPQFPWYGDTELELDFPDAWKVEVSNAPGWYMPAMTKKEMQRAFLNPIGTRTIAELAKNKKEVVIIFDDLSRPTKVYELVPFVLQELHKAGIKDENIRFIPSAGSHGTMKLMDFEKKLGPEIVQKYPVYNHNTYENCTYLGETSRGTPVRINSEVMFCDFKIAIGCIIPHLTAGFGGGAKSILPGVAHIETIRYNHTHFSCQPNMKPLNDDYAKTTGFGVVDGNAQRLDMEETARMVGLDICVNAVTNLHRDTIGLFVGDLVAAHRQGVEFARKMYATEKPEAADVVIANAYAKASEGIVIVDTVSKLVKEGGDLVMICNIPEGQICHFLSRSFGKSIGGALYSKRTALPAKIGRMIVLGPCIDRAGVDWLGPAEAVIIAKSWEEILGLIKNKYKKPRLTVLPDATLQFYPSPSVSTGENNDSCVNPVT